MILALQLLLGCPTAIECDADTPCPFGETCEAGQCVTPACSTSQQCPIEHFCERRECVPGCEGDADCMPGFRCGTDADLELKGTCLEDTCLETRVDCGYREFCNPATGDCYDAGTQYCKFCNEDAECGAGNKCLAHYCGVNCEGGRECPNGFECYLFTDDFGNPAAYQCFTYCWLYEGFEPGASSPTPPGVIEIPGLGTGTALEASP